jgi:hypothetical protein
LQRSPGAKPQSKSGSLTKVAKKPEGKNKVSTEAAKMSTKTAAESTESNAFNVNGMKIDAVIARNAIILSEIIGPPKAKRRRGKR